MCFLPFSLMKLFSGFSSFLSFFFLISAKNQHFGLLDLSNIFLFQTSLIFLYYFLIVLLFYLPCTLNNFLNCKYIYFTLAFIARAIWGYIFSSSHCFKCIPLILTCNISSYYFLQKFWNFNSYFPSSHSCLIEGFKFPNRRNLRSF